MEVILIQWKKFSLLPSSLKIITLKLLSKHSIRTKGDREFGRFLSRPWSGMMNHSYPLLQNTSPVIKLRLSCRFSIFLGWTMREKHCQVFSYWAILSVIQAVPLFSCITICLSFCLPNINAIPVLPFWGPGHLVWNWGTMQILWSHVDRQSLIYSPRFLNIVYGFY